ncbi:hypothetical protein [Helicobacter pylori]|uniref:hypothetical protein n=1 Tax=Helicobacter pylori TaxID=210 RepID=UPI00165A9FD2|nr:hypothetical protein [Helicobacter pylori]
MKYMKFGNMACVEMIDLINLVRKRIADHADGKEAIEIVRDLRSRGFNLVYYPIRSEVRSSGYDTDDLMG